MEESTFSDNRERERERGRGVDRREKREESSQGSCLAVSEDGKYFLAARCYRVVLFSLCNLNKKEDIMGNVGKVPYVQSRLWLLPFSAYASCSSLRIERQCFSLRGLYTCLHTGLQTL